MSIYANWKRRLAGEKVPMHDGEVDCGFYRRKKTISKVPRQWVWEPVAFWTEGGGALVGVLGPVHGGKMLDANGCADIWTHCGQHPISEEQWRAVAEKGEPWHDSHEEKPKAEKPAAQVGGGEHPDDKAAIAAALEATGGPQPPETPESKLAKEIADGKAKLPTYATIDSDEMSAKARSLQQFFLDKRSAAEKAYDALNRPLLDEQKRIRAIWFPLKEEADSASKTLLKAMGDWEDEKRKVARLAAEAEAKRQREHQEAARKAEEKGKPAPPPPEPVKQNIPAPASQIKGGTGRAAAVTVWHEVKIEDIDKVFQFLKTNPAVLTVLLAEAQKKQNAGISVPGTSTTERTRIR
jgi:hypothetical protein